MNKLTNEELKRLKNRLVADNRIYMSEETTGAKAEELEERWKWAQKSSAVSTALENSFSDEQLIFIIRDATGVLNHSPSQKELLPALRDFIKRRFGKWPYALTKAGVARSAGKQGITCEQQIDNHKEKMVILSKLREKTKAMGHVPHPHQVGSLKRGVEKYFDSWYEALDAAGINSFTVAGFKGYKIDNLTEDDLNRLEYIKNKAKELGRVPTHMEIPCEIKKPLIKSCGSWRNALFQIGMIPVIRRKPFSRTYLDHRSRNNPHTHNASLHNCYFKLVNIDEATAAALKNIKEFYCVHNYFPSKDEVPVDQRTLLIQQCKTWANVLYQLGYVEEYINKKS